MEVDLDAFIRMHLAEPVAKQVEYSPKDVHQILDLAKAGGEGGRSSCRRPSPGGRRSWR